MKDILILFGKPSCNLCKLSDEILSNQKILAEYELIRINIISFINNSNVLDVLGMNKAYDLINTISEKFGNEYVLVFKYNPGSQVMSHIPFKKYLVIAQISNRHVDFDELLKDLRH